MAYDDVSVVVDGALEEERTIHDYLLLEEYVAAVKDDAIGHGYPTQIYVLHHEHNYSPDHDCECVQYVTDHLPYWSSVEDH